MKSAGLQKIERAKKDGRWDAAYDSPSGTTVPSDFQAALDGNAQAKAFFASLDARNRFAVNGSHTGFLRPPEEVRVDTTTLSPKGVLFRSVC